MLKNGTLHTFLVTLFKGLIWQMALFWMDSCQFVTTLKHIKSSCDASIASWLPSFRQRHSDRDMFNQMLVIIESNKRMSVKIQQIMRILKREETLISILMQTISRVIPEAAKPIDRTKRVLYDAENSCAGGMKLSRRRDAWSWRGMQKMPVRLRKEFRCVKKARKWPNLD